MKENAILLLVPALVLPVFVCAGVSKAFSGAGSGTQAYPYIIADVNQLQEMNDDLYACYELGNDIDASDTRNWNNGEGFVPIGAEVVNPMEIAI